MKWVLLKNNKIKKRNSKMTLNWVHIMMVIARLQREFWKDRCRFKINISH